MVFSPTAAAVPTAPATHPAAASAAATDRHERDRAETDAANHHHHDHDNHDGDGHDAAAAAAPAAPEPHPAPHRPTARAGGAQGSRLHRRGHELHQLGRGQSDDGGALCWWMSELHPRGRDRGGGGAGWGASG